MAAGALSVASSPALAVAGDVGIAKYLNTSGLFAEVGKSYHNCVIANVSTTNISIKIDLLDTFGATLNTTGATPITLNAGAITLTSTTVNSTYTGLARCRFTILGGADDAVRANESVYSIGGTFTDTIAFSEAR